MKQNNNQIGDYLTLGIQIALNMVAPVLIGIYADKYFDSSPWGLIIGAILGFGAVSASLVKITLQANRENEQRKKKKK